MKANGSPSETSPLLAKPTNVVPESPDAPNGVIPSGSNTDGRGEEGVKSVDQEQAQPDGEDGETQYQGLPEVKKQLKYIVPAVAIGVHPERAHQTNQKLRAIDLSSCRRSDNHRQHLWSDWK